MLRRVLARAVVLGIALLAPAGAGAADLCAKQAPPEAIGALDVETLREASGLAISRAYSGRLYHHQDSGDGPNFYITDIKGAPRASVAVSGFTPIDVEDMALGRCGRNRTCLFLADVGDNFEKRPTVQIAIVAEKKTYGARVKPLRVVTAKYPDGPHNAEGVAIHPNGDLFLITKSFDAKERRAMPAKVFKLSAAQLARPAKVETFAEVGAIDLPYILFDYGMSGQIVTGLDISADGGRVLALTYRNAIEFALDLSKPMTPSRTWKPGEHFRILDIAKLPQAEAIAYEPGDDSFLYDSEVVRDGVASPLYRSACVR